MPSTNDLMHGWLNAGTATPIPKVVLTNGTTNIGRVYNDMSATGTNGAILLISKLPSSAATTNATLVKAGVSRVALIAATNASAAIKYIKLFNKATAPVPGTDTPYLTFAIPAGQVLQVDFTSIGMNFATGIGFAITGAAADLDATAVAAGDIVGLNIVYI